MDSNNFLSKKEFGLYTFLTEGKAIDDDGWKTINGIPLLQFYYNFTVKFVHKLFYQFYVLKEQVKLDKNDELSKEKFLELSKIEISHTEVDIKDIWERMQAIGFNKNLELDQVRKNIRIN